MDTLPDLAHLEAPLIQERGLGRGKKEELASTQNSTGTHEHTPDQISKRDLIGPLSRGEFFHKNQKFRFPNSGMVSLSKKGNFRATISG